MPALFASPTPDEKNPRMTQPLDTLICFATRWGPQFGGINSFNHDLLGAFAALYYRQARAVCVVLWASEAEKADAKAQQIELVSLELESEKNFLVGHEHAVWAALAEADIAMGEQCVWLGHDRITGAVALAAKAKGGRSALIHHMCYDRYEPYLENAVKSRLKTDEQHRLFERADIVMAVGPLLRDALRDALDREDIPMLIPGLAEIKAKSTAPLTLKGFLSGRLSNDAQKLKQANLGVVAFSQAIRRADAQPEVPNKFHGKNEPKLLLRGVDVENSSSQPGQAAEADLRRYAAEHAGRVVNIQPLPFTLDRQVLFDDLRGSTFAMMPSWHEGFGLVAWEAIAAGVPLVLSVKSGAYKLLEELEQGSCKSWVTPIDVEGSEDEPYHSDNDVERLVKAITAIAHDPGKRVEATRLREKLCSLYTWAECARACGLALGWTVRTHEPEQVQAAPALPVAPAPVVATSAISVPAACAPQGLLGLPQAHWRVHQGLSDSQLLRAEERVVPFDANREPFLETQLTWATASVLPVAVRLLSGPGGVGKTRLALEMCHRLSEAGWQTGFVSGENDTGQVVEFAQQLKGCERPSLLVIDYAETRQSLVLAVCKALKDRDVLLPVRLLLLARDGGEWWRALPGKDVDCEPLLGGEATSGPFPIPALHDGAPARQTAYQAALQAFAQKLDISPPVGVPNLDDEHFIRPLYIQMAALMALRGERPQSAEGLPRALVNHERRYWKRMLEMSGLIGGLAIERAGLLMTLSTLAKGIATEKMLEDVWDIPDQERGALKQLFRALTPLYPDRQGLQGLRPDLIGEALVAQSLLTERGLSLLDQILASGSSALRRSSLTVLARLLRDREDLMAVVEEVLTRHFISCIDDWIAVCIETTGPFVQLMESIYQKLPAALLGQATGILKQRLTVDVLPLASLCVHVFQTEVEKCRQKVAQKSSIKTLSNYSNALTSLSIAWRNNGETDQALKCIEQARALWPTVRKDLQTESYLARQLSISSSLLSRLGRDTDALQCAEQALHLTRRIVAGTGQGVTEELAVALGIYATCLAECGLLPQAIMHSGESVQVARLLGRTAQGSHECCLAVSLSKHSSCLAQDGDIDEALKCSEEALAIRQRLSDLEPHRHLANLGKSKLSYTSLVVQVGEVEKALQWGEQTLILVRKLAGTKPERFEGDLADALFNFSIILMCAKHFERAVVISREASMFYQRLASVNPERYLIDFEESKLSHAFAVWLATGASMHQQLNQGVATIDNPRGLRSLEYQHHFLSMIQDQDRAAMQRVRACWRELDSSQRFSWRDKHLVLVAFSEHLFGIDETDAGWRDQFAEVRAQGRGRIPAWMYEMARRLGFSLPAAS